MHLKLPFFRPEKGLEQGYILLCPKDRNLLRWVLKIVGLKSTWPIGKESHCDKNKVLVEFTLVGQI